MLCRLLLGFFALHLKAERGEISHVARVINAEYLSLDVVFVDPAKRHSHASSFSRVGRARDGDHRHVIFRPPLAGALFAIAVVFGFNAMRLYDSLSSVFKWEAIT